MLGFAEARALIVPREFRGFDYPAMVEGLRDVLPALEHLFVVGGADPRTSFEACLLERHWEEETDCDALFSARRPDPDDVVEIMYTSGTTGQPKGVMHTSNTLMCKALLSSELFGFGAGALVELHENFGVQAEAKFMVMLPTSGFVIAPTISPVFMF